MGISKAEFARQCGVSRAAVTKAATDEKQTIVCEPNGTIDLSHPKNRAYLELHRSGAPHPGPMAATRRPTEGKRRPAAARKSPPAPRDVGREIDGLDAATRDLLAASGDDENEEEADDDLSLAIRTPAFVARKHKLQGDMLEIAKAEKLGAVIDRKIFESVFMGLSQYIFTEFAESPKADALEICKALGVPGKESIVTEILSHRNQNRLQNVKRMAAEAEEAKKRIK